MSLTTLPVKLHICATNCMANCVHPNTVVKIKINKLFCICLAWTLPT